MGNTPGPRRAIVTAAACGTGYELARAGIGAWPAAGAAILALWLAYSWTIARVLAKRIERGQMTQDQALTLARQWFYDNPKTLYRLEL